MCIRDSGQREPAQGHHIDGLFEEMQADDGGQDGQRDRGPDDDRGPPGAEQQEHDETCLLYTSDAADERSSVDLGGRRIIKKKKKTKKKHRKKKKKKHTNEIATGIMKQSGQSEDTNIPSVTLNQ